MTDKIKNLNSAVVRTTDGIIDTEATLASFAEQVLALVDQEEERGVDIDLAANAVFDANRGVTLSMPFVCGAVVQALVAKGLVTPATFNTMLAQVGAWVRSNPAFKVAKGKGGGVVRLCDVPPKEAK